MWVGKISKTGIRRQRSPVNCHRCLMIGTVQIENTACFELGFHWSLLCLLRVFMASTICSGVACESEGCWPQRGTKFTKGTLESGISDVRIAKISGKCTVRSGETVSPVEIVRSERYGTFFVDTYRNQSAMFRRRSFRSHNWTLVFANG